MARQTDPKPDDPPQYQRFLDLAAKLEAEGNEREIDKAVKRLAKHPRQKPKVTKGGGGKRR